MKKIIILLSFGLFTVLLLNANAMGIRNMSDKLSGYIEILLDNNSIIRIDLATGKAKEMLSQERGNYLYNFDVSPDGKKTVLETDKGLLLYTEENKKLNSLINKSNAISFPSFSPDGESIAYLSMKNERERKNRIDDRYLHITKTDSISDKQLLPLTCDMHKPSWFPDGKKIAIGSKDLAIYVIDVNKGTDKRIIDFGLAPTVSHDGKKIIYLSKEVDDSVKNKMVNYQKISMKEYQDTFMNKKDNREEGSLAVLFYSYSFFIYDVSSGNSKKITDEIFVKPSSSLIWSPDDKYILYTDNKWEHHNIYILNIKSGEKKKITHGEAMTWR